MPLERYTASGNINPAAMPGPSIDAATRPWEAVSRAGGGISGLGGQLSALVADNRALGEQRKKESELAWVNETMSSLNRIAAERHKDDGQPERLRETEADEFRQFADLQIQEHLKSAPSSRAAGIFKQRATGLTDQIWESSLKRAEDVRLGNIVQANIRTTTNNASAYKDLAATVGPDIAAATVTPSINLQLASIEEQFGKTAPALAAKMSLSVVEEMAITAAATNPDFARRLVATSRIAAETKVILNNKIDSIQSTATALERDRFTREIADRRVVAIQSGRPLRDITDTEWKVRFGPNWEIAKQGYEADQRDIQVAIEMSKGGVGVNPAEQQRIASKAAASDDPAVAKVAPMLSRMADQSAELAARDPVEWQLQRDPDISEAESILNTLPIEAQPAYKSSLYELREARQGFPPAGDPHPERYLGRSVTYPISAAEADARKQAFNTATPDEKLRMISEFESEFGDPVMANKVWSAMVELGKEQIPVGYRFASIINDVNTRKEFVNAQTAAKALEKLDDNSLKKYTEAMNKEGGPWRSFRVSWYGQAAEGRQDVVDAKGALLNYARHIASRHGLDPEDAMAKAMERVISANYGFTEINGRKTAIGKRRLIGGPDRTDAEIEDIGRRLGVALKDIPVQELSLTGPGGEPLFPNLPASYDPKNPESVQQLRDYVTTRGFWEVDGSGEMVTLMAAEEGGDGVALVDKENRPLTVKLDDLPTYTTAPTGFPGFGGGLGDLRRGAFETKIPKQSTYPIVEQNWWNKLGIFPSQIRTNWPTRPPWLGGDRMGRNFKLD